MNTTEEEYKKYGKATQDFAIGAIDLLEELTHKYELRDEDDREMFVRYALSLLDVSLNGTEDEN